MKNWIVEILYPWDDTWYTLDFVPPKWSRRGAENSVREIYMAVYGRATQFRVTNTKTGKSFKVE